MPPLRSPPFPITSSPPLISRPRHPAPRALRLSAKRIFQRHNGPTPSRNLFTLLTPHYHGPEKNHTSLRTHHQRRRQRIPHPPAPRTPARQHHPRRRPRSRRHGGILLRFNRLRHLLTRIPRNRRHIQRQEADVHLPRHRPRQHRNRGHRARRPGKC